MFPSQFPIKAVCWDNAGDALEYHKDILGEFPIGRGWVYSDKGPTFATILVNPVKPSWTFLHFHQNAVSGDVVVCAITGGSMWETLTPGNDDIEL